MTLSHLYCVLWCGTVWSVRRNLLPPFRHFCVRIKQKDHEAEYVGVRLRLEAPSHLINKVRVVCVPSAGVTRFRAVQCHRAFPFVLHDQPLDEDFVEDLWWKVLYGLQRCRNPRSLQYVMSGSRKLEVIVPYFGGVKACVFVCPCLSARSRYTPTGYTFFVTHVQKWCKANSLESCTQLL